jgi:hypothetical protein
MTLIQCLAGTTTAMQNFAHGNVWKIILQYAIRIRIRHGTFRANPLLGIISIDEFLLFGN